jgi:Protein of unknown function (DUF3300)
MKRQEGCAGRRTVMAAAAMLAVAVLLGALEAEAQETPQTPAEAPTAGAIAEASAVDVQETAAPLEGALSPEELQALVAPIALYPDLVLILTLQASLAPLDIVQADRFLANYAKDPSLTPDPDWDQSVIGLLNYPSVIHGMNADLDWTQALGDAVLNQLEGVQDAIQDVRAFMRAVGALESNDKMTVVVVEDNISIRPADPDAVFIPQYDSEALLTALYSTDVTAEAAEPSAAGAEAAGPEAEAAAAPAEATAPAEAAAETEPAPVTEAPAPAPEGQAMVLAGAPAYPAPAYPAPAYYPPPPMAYSDPSPSWLGTAATFAGGAVVGGLVGWAIADDDDDNHDHGYGSSNSNSVSRGNLNVSDSTITVNRGGAAGGGDKLKLRAENERLKRDASVKERREQTKEELNRKYAANQPRAAATPASRSKYSGLATSRARQSAATTRQSPGGKELTGRVQQAKAKSSPSRSAKVSKAGASRKAAVRPGDRKQPQAASAFGNTKSPRQAKKESDRGLKSRSGAKTQVKPNRGGGGGSSVFAQRSGGGGGGARGAAGGKQSRRGKK